MDLSKLLAFAEDYFDDAEEADPDCKADPVYWLDINQSELMYYIVLYMQITEEQCQKWSDNPDMSSFIRVFTIISILFITQEMLIKISDSNVRLFYHTESTSTLPCGCKRH